MGAHRRPRVVVAPRAAVFPAAGGQSARRSGAAGTRRTGGAGGIAAPHPLSRAFLAAAAATGMTVLDDYNGARQEGIGYTQVTMRAGLRVTAASAYLASARARPNLTVLTNAHVRRIGFDGTRATHVEIERGGETRRIVARREVLLCAGTVGSPELLLLLRHRRCPRPGGARARGGGGSCGGRPRPAGPRATCTLVYRTRVPSYNRDARGWRLVREAARYVAVAPRPTRQHGERGQRLRALARRARTPWPAARVPCRRCGDYRGGRYVVHGFDAVMAMASLLHPAQPRSHRAAQRRSARGARDHGGAPDSADGRRRVARRRAPVTSRSSRRHRSPR